METILWRLKPREATVSDSDGIAFKVELGLLSELIEPSPSFEFSLIFAIVAIDESKLVSAGKDEKGLGLPAGITLMMKNYLIFLLT